MRVVADNEKIVIGAQPQCRSARQLQRMLESSVGIATSATHRDHCLADDVICRERCGSTIGLN